MVSISSTNLVGLLCVVVGLKSFWYTFKSVLGRERRLSGGKTLPTSAGRRKAGVLAQRTLRPGQDVEEALTDALVRGTELHKFWTQGAKNFDKLTYKLGVTFPLYIPYVKERLEVKKEPVQVLWPWVLKLSWFSSKWERGKIEWFMFQFG